MSELITSPADLQAEIEKLKAENESLRKADGTITGGMTEPANKIVKVIQQFPYKGEKLAPTTRTDAGFDPTQRFAGRQP